MEVLRNNKLAENLLHLALAQGASDMHIEPDGQGVRVRIRVDGLLQQLCVLPRTQQSTLLTQLKVWSGMDIAEKRVPQDGRLLLEHEGSEVDLRLASLPTVNGEKLAIRFLQRQDNLLQLEHLQFSESNLQRYRQLFHQPNGLVLLTGPTGSGKTTTLYATLQELDAAAGNIITLEDPVEYNIPGVNQCQINEKTGMTFASGLRAILRQDPDIIAVGEIRDGETASIAMRAAITGHLVFSTLHTNDAVSAVHRLEDIGVEPWLVSSALRGVVSQRLVRKLCPHCKTAYRPSAEELLLLGLPEDSDVTFYKGAGCPECRHSGYIGRRAVFEILLLNSRLRRRISHGADGDELLAAARQDGFTTLRESCRELVLAGVTSAAEAARVINTAAET